MSTSDNSAPEFSSNPYYGEGSNAGAWGAPSGANPSSQPLAEVPPYGAPDAGTGYETPGGSHGYGAAPDPYSYGGDMPAPGYDPYASGAQQPMPGAAPYGAGPQYADPSNARTGMSVTGMVLGIVSILASWLFVIGLLLGVGGLIFSMVARKQEPAGHGMAIAGLVTSCVGIGLSLLTTLWNLLGLFLGVVPLLFF